ncbi:MULTISPECIES: ComF family protein [unclassified Pseudomonas]|uniref:ComF family protein n=1 Tax=unclassified Pseudomonas TaxID=196821 RepID=UPI000CE5F860|nr:MULTISPECIES: ComF family protein [unclassified Pseudomonas]AVD88144.1 amidophosphoribosyltransferase [Pseudomonas sp. SWI44]QQZ35944.1 ComF family protein [Pseudomonas sp. SK2]
MYCQPLIKQLVYKCLNINHACLLCDEASEQPHPICVACEHELPWLHDCCLRCALPLPMPGLTCAQCCRRAPAFAQVVALWHYGFPVDTLISRFKHNQQWPLGRLMAELLVHGLQHRYDEGLAKPDLLLPVPLAKRRQRERGFNQAGMLARWLSVPLAIPCDERLLQRVRDTPAQQHLHAKARRQNLRGAFNVGRGRAVENLHIAVVDDVLTTGATAQAIAQSLRKSGARRVDVYCLARTPKPDRGWQAGT